MKFWLSLLFEPADQLVDHARVAEELGFEGVVLPDHIVVKEGERTPHPRGHPLQPDEVFLDPFCAFSAMAAVTTRLRFLNFVYVVPLRDPFALAKQAGTVALLSDNRFVLGTGVGWLREEFETVGQRWAERGARMDEMLDIVRDFWDDGYAEFHGAHYDFPRSGMFPVPSERIPIWIGGHSMVAARRAAHFDGYVPMDGLDDRTRRQFEEIERIREAAGSDGPFERMVVWPGGHDPGVARRMEDADGITSVLVLAWPLGDPSLTSADKRASVEQFASMVLSGGS